MHLTIDGLRFAFTDDFYDSVKPQRCMSWVMWPLKVIIGLHEFVMTGLAYTVSYAFKQ